MSTALQLQFFMVQAVNYSVIIVKIKCKNPQYHKRKRLPWCELINPYIFFHCQCVSPYFTKNVSERTWSSQDSRVWGASRPASRKLQRLVSVSAQKVSCTSLFWCTRSDGNNFKIIFLRINWANSVQFKRVFYILSQNWERDWAPRLPCLHHWSCRFFIAQ